jgi:diketogulonate reductase-like aldo/keto reductase
LNDPVIGKIAGKYAHSPAQIMIRWSLQHGLIPIPKSSNKKRIFENAEIFDFHIENNDMKALDNLS